MDLTLSIIKPDAVKRNITGEINSLIEKNDMKIVAQKMLDCQCLGVIQIYMLKL